ncbi:MAG: Ppx/GppA family phosphatase [Clostridia bacterium]|nr:Ppx/GppA family phosphatase [Clostridia bacterium]
MIKAAIDIGSNSVRLLVADKKGDRLAVKQQLLRTTRLGAGCGILLAQNIAQTVEAVAEMQQIAEKWGVYAIPLIATSACRDAGNTAELAEAIEQKTGLRLTVISGEREAELSFTGAASVLEDTGQAVVLDIGGSSTELIWQTKDGFSAHSLKLGAVRAARQQWSRERVRSIIEEYPIPSLADKQLVGVGGTVTTLAALAQGLSVYEQERVHSSRLTIKQIAAIYNSLAVLSVEQRCAFSLLLKERGEIIVEGIMILQELMKKLSQRSIIVSDSGILAGILSNNTCTKL